MYSYSSFLERPNDGSMDLFRTNLSNNGIPDGIIFETRGGHLHKQYVTQHCNNGERFALNNKLILLNHL